MDNVKKWFSTAEIEDLQNRVSKGIKNWEFDCLVGKWLSEPAARELADKLMRARNGAVGEWKGTTLKQRLIAANEQLIEIERVLRGGS